VVVSKAAQVGGTTYGILRALHACLQGLDVMYFFPTRTDVLDFWRSRVGPLLADNAFLARQLTDRVQFCAGCKSQLEREALDYETKIIRRNSEEHEKKMLLYNKYFSS